VPVPYPDRPATAGGEGERGGHHEQEGRSDGLERVDRHRDGGGDPNRHQEKGQSRDGEQSKEVRQDVRGGYPGRLAGGQAEAREESVAKAAAGQEGEWSTVRDGETYERREPHAAERKRSANQPQRQVVVTDQGRVSKQRDEETRHDWPEAQLSHRREDLRVAVLRQHAVQDQERERKNRYIERECQRATGRRCRSLHGHPSANAPRYPDFARCAGCSRSAGV